MATGTLSGNTCSAYGAPATIVGTTSQTVATGHCYLLTLTGTDNVGNTAAITHHGHGRHHRAARTHRFQLQRARPTPTTRAPAPPSTTRAAPPAASPPPPPARPTPTPASPPTPTARSRDPAGQTPPAPTPSPPPPPAAAQRSPPPTTQDSPARAPASPPPPTPPHRRGGAFTANSVVATPGGSSSYLNSGTTLTINSRTDYTDGGSGLASSTLTMATGTLSGNTCSAYGAPATIVGTTAQTVASGHCYLLTLTGTDNVGNTASISHHRHGRHHRPERTHGYQLQRADQRLLPGQRVDRLLQGRRRRRLHRHRLGRHRRRLGHRRLHVPGARSELGERRRCLHLQRDCGHPVRVGHRAEQRRTYRRRLDLHRPGRHERADRRRVHRQRRRPPRSAAPRAISRRGRR